jgi:leucyl aminopeptidase
VKEGGIVEVQVVQEDVTRVNVPALIVNLFEGVKEPGGATGAVDRALGGGISQLIREGEVKGKKGEITLIHTFGKIGPSRVLVAGLGKSEGFGRETVREVMAGSCRHLRRLGIRHVATIAHGSGIAGLDAAESGQAIVEGAALGLYRFNSYITRSDDDSGEMDRLSIVERDPDKLSELERGVERGRLLAQATILARDMVNEPANVMTPTRMAEIAGRVAQEEGLELRVLERHDMEELGMGAFLGVARGSDQPPKLIVLEYRGDPGDPSNNLGLIGKGITFDTGGISLKPPAGMEDMKGDMAGGASVIAAMMAVGRLKPRINVTGMVAATENMPGGSAQRPGDVVRSMSGKTIEVINTDAEGRLVLADALYYARQRGITRLVDVATLTGAMVVALGHACSGVMGNDQTLVDRLMKSGELAGERIWQLPMFDDYKEQIKSSVADIKNTGGREAGSITAAQFLAEFAGDTSWAHLDIAGTYLSGKDKGYVVKGGTGVPTRTLVNLVLDLSRPD